jgi:hypothetical protein
MDNPVAGFADLEECQGASDSDIHAMLAMLDYLIGELRSIDATCARHLVDARQSLLDIAASRFVRRH